MPNLDTILAPRALTSEELASVIVPQLIAYGLTSRAFTHGYVWDEEKRDGATRCSAESVQTSIIEDANASIRDWLADMQTDGDPRFFNGAGLRKAIEQLCSAASRMFCAVGSDLESGDGETLEALILGLEERGHQFKVLLDAASE